MGISVTKKSIETCVVCILGKYIQLNSGSILHTFLNYRNTNFVIFKRIRPNFIQTGEKLEKSIENKQKKPDLFFSKLSFNKSLQNCINLRHHK